MYKTISSHYYFYSTALRHVCRQWLPCYKGSETTEFLRSYDVSPTLIPQTGRPAPR